MLKCIFTLISTNPTFPLSQRQVLSINVEFWRDLREDELEHCIISKKTMFKLSSSLGLYLNRLEFFSKFTMDNLEK